MKSDSNNSYKIFKILQLVLLIIFFIAFLLYLRMDPVIKNNIFTNSNLLTICVFLWAFMIFCFISLIFDLNHLEKSITKTHSLQKVAYLDSLTGIPNRQSCDIIFEQYENDSDISDLGCALVAISNLKLINEALGRSKGNLLIQEFATVFENVGDKYGFVGRNGGNEFIIVIENCNEKKMKKFLDELAKEVQYYNNESNHMPVTYKAYDILNQELGKESFSELIASLYKIKGTNEHA